VSPLTLAYETGPTDAAVEPVIHASTGLATSQFHPQLEVEDQRISSMVRSRFRPRPSYDVRRWSTVFPFGMYAACSFVVGTAAPVEGISDFARVWVWVVVAVWAVVLVAMFGRGARAIR
jgi:Voltage-dependent anion channel